MWACPSCKREWPDERGTCQNCMASLVDDPDDTLGPLGRSIVEGFFDQTALLRRPGSCR
jgi:predicted amidophosphoribosyltransferase